MIGGETWQRWYPMLQKQLLDTVKREETYAIGVLGSDVGPSTIQRLCEHPGDPYHYIPLYQR